MILAHPRSIVVCLAWLWNGCVSCAHSPADPLLRNQMAAFKTTAFNLEPRGPRAFTGARFAVRGAIGAPRRGSGVARLVHPGQLGEAL